ncbi:MAG: hypothetical protein ABL925_17030 [Methylococcales bacterium]
MNIKLSNFVVIAGSLLLSVMLVGCDKFSSKPQVEDINSVGCLITNDFYAVHFSAYLKPEGQAATDSDKKALLTPYCQELPKPGKAFFAADLIDRDIRKTPIGIRVIEIEKTGEKAEDFKEIRSISEVAPQMYPRGVVETQASIDKNGDYILMLIIGGEEALSAEDRLKIPFHVGGSLFGLNKQELTIIASAVGGSLVVLLIVLFWLRKRKKN